MMIGSIFILLHLKSKNGIKLGWIMTLPPYPKQETILGVHTKTFTSQSKKWLRNERLKNIYKHCLLQVYIKERKKNVNRTCNYRTLLESNAYNAIVSNFKLWRSKQAYVRSFSSSVEKFSLCMVELKLYKIRTNYLFLWNSKLRMF